MQKTPILLTRLCRKLQFSCIRACKSQSTKVVESDPVSSFEADFNADCTSEEYVSSNSHLQCSTMLSSIDIAELMMQMVGHSEFLD